ncbi:MAG: hypothetical protein EBT22_04180 [Chloroflexi bacterium]|nr:hypothetical protein [Chloroflexota bacterium]
MARNRRAVKSDAPLAPRNRPMFRRLFDRNKSDGPAILGTEPRATVGLRVTYVQCANVRDLHPGEIKPVRVRGGHELALAIIDGRVHAFEAYCPHQAWPLKWSEAETGAPVRIREAEGRSCGIWPFLWHQRLQLRALPAIQMRPRPHRGERAQSQSR